MKAIIIKGLSMPNGENTFVDLRIQSNGTALQVGCMGHCSVYQAEEVDLPEEEK